MISSSFMFLLTFFSGISCVVFALFLLDFTLAKEKRSVFVLPFLASIVIPLWTILATINAPEEFHTITKKVQSAEGIDFVVVDAKMINLNSVLGMDFEEGSDIILTKKKPSTKFWIVFPAGNWQCRAN